MNVLGIQMSQRAVNSLKHHASHASFMMLRLHPLTPLYPHGWQQVIQTLVYTFMQSIGPWTLHQPAVRVR